MLRSYAHDAQKLTMLSNQFKDKKEQYKGSREKHNGIMLRP